MNFEIKKIKLKNLKAYSESDEFRSLKTIPISRNRITSYIHNPRAKQNDWILYMAFQNTELVGFRTILPDYLNNDGSIEKFGWFSGNWVNPNYRRKGISTLLMNEVLNDWNHRLLYTNYAPNSKALYDKSNEFDLLCQKQGMRFYFKSQFSELLTPRNKFFSRIKPFFKITDFVINVVVIPFNKIYSKSLTKYIKKINISSSATKEHYSLITEYTNSVFQRSKEEYEWIFNFPWVSTSNNDRASYPFSSTAYSFNYYFLSIYKNYKLDSLAIVKIRDGLASIPYFHASSNLAGDLSKAILAFAYQQNAKMLTSYNDSFIKEIKKLGFISFLKKTMLQKYFILKIFKNHLHLKSKDIETLDGDGDCIFT